MLCLTEWTSDENLGEGCKAVLPERKKGKEEKVDKEKAAWRAARKAYREQAIEDINKEKKKQEKKDKKAKKEKEKAEAKKKKEEEDKMINAPLPKDVDAAKKELADVKAQ